MSNKNASFTSFRIIRYEGTYQLEEPKKECSKKRIRDQNFSEEDDSIDQNIDSDRSNSTRNLKKMKFNEDNLKEKYQFSTNLNDSIFYSNKDLKEPYINFKSEDIKLKPSLKSIVELSNESQDNRETSLSEKIISQTSIKNLHDIIKSYDEPIILSKIKKLDEIKQKFMKSNRTKKELLNKWLKITETSPEFDSLIEKFLSKKDNLLKPDRKTIKSTIPKATTISKKQIKLFRRRHQILYDKFVNCLPNKKLKKKYNISDAFISNSIKCVERVLNKDLLNENNYIQRKPRTKILPEHLQALDNITLS